jgi:hypothetical protein
MFAVLLMPMGETTKTLAVFSIVLQRETFQLQEEHMSLYEYKNRNSVLFSMSECFGSIEPVYMAVFVHE